MERNFFDLLKNRWDQDFFVCVGLDIEYDKIPQHIRDRHTMKEEPWGAMLDFGKQIVDATHDYACAYKPNTAFYEAYGPKGMRTLFDLVAYIKERYPDIPIINDAKRGDIGNTNARYAAASFDELGVDAVTVQPYLGKEPLEPFLQRKEKGCIVLCRTSNPGAGEFQDMLVDGIPLWQRVAHNVRDSWNEHKNCGLVVGAPYPGEMKTIRDSVGDIPFLIPGVGAQGGNGINEVVRAGMDSNRQGMIINSSRSIIYASSDENFAERAREETQKLHNAINHSRTKT